MKYFGFRMANWNWFLQDSNHSIRSRILKIHFTDDVWNNNGKDITAGHCDNQRGFIYILEHPFHIRHTFSPIEFGGDGIITQIVRRSF